ERRSVTARLGTNGRFDVIDYGQPGGNLPIIDYGPGEGSPAVLRPPFRLPSDGKSRQITMASSVGSFPGVPYLAVGTVGGSMFVLPAKRVASIPPGVPDDNDPVSLHPVGFVAGGLLMTTAAQPWKEAVELFLWRRSGAVIRWTGVRRHLVWNSQARWISSPKGDVIGLVDDAARQMYASHGARQEWSVAADGRIALAPSGRRTWSVRSDLIDAWDTTAGDGPRRLPSVRVQGPNLGASHVVSAVAAFDDRLVMAWSDGSIKAVDVLTGRPTAERHLGGDVREIVTLPGQNYVAVLTTSALHLLDHQLADIAKRPVTEGFRLSAAPQGGTVALRTADAVMAYALPYLRPVLNRPLIGGNNIVAYGPAPTDDGSVVMPDGEVHTGCAVCATDDPAQLRAAAGRILAAASIPG
ncbi:hypothetical protein KBX08_32535, partial [Micromonospora sp. H61]|uniref:hypothetical protein n=1 Tax=Micromonospora sp. H61 TaxID=2824888 RepID=UPI001B39A03C